MVLLISGGPHKANIIGTHLNVVAGYQNWQFIYAKRRRIFRIYLALVIVILFIVHDVTYKFIRENVKPLVINFQ